MDRNQALAFLRDVANLPKDGLGTGATFYDGKPCCAVGHLAHKAGYQPGAEDDDVLAGDVTVREAYGLASVDEIFDANDNGNASIKGFDDDSAARWERLQIVAQNIVDGYGVDPDELLAEIGAGSSA